MDICNTVDLRDKEVINVCDGARLGYATDFEIDLCDAKIRAIVIPEKKGIFGIGKTEEIVIPWERIACIGEDTVLVKLSSGEMDACRKSRSERQGCRRQKC